MNRFWLVVLLACLTFPAQAAEKKKVSKTWPPKGIVLVDGIVGVVNTDPITLYQLVRAAGPYVAKLRKEANATTNVRKELRKIYNEVLNSLMNDVLIHARAKKRGIKVTKGQIDAQVNQVQTMNQWSDEQFKQALKQMGFDSVAAYRKHAAREIMKNRLIGREVSSRIKIDKSEVTRIFKEKFGGGSRVEERRAAHILIRVPELAPKSQAEAARVKLMAIRAKVLDKSETFEELARRHSQDTTRAAGGDMGWFTKGDTDPDFEKAAFALKLNGVSLPIRSAFGVHLIKTTGIRVKSEITPKKKRSILRQIRYRLREKQLMTLYKKWVAFLRSDAFIQKTSLLGQVLGQ